MTDFKLTDLTIQIFDDSEVKNKSLARIFPFDAEKIDEKIDESQKKGCGVFFPVNPQEDPNERGVDNTSELKRFGLDLDGSKEAQGLAKEEIDRKKKEMRESLKSLEIQPSYLIETKNGLQPLWVFKTAKALPT